MNKSSLQLSSLEIAYGMSQNGICQGDSGGPVLTASGGEKVVGIHSYVSGGGCNGTGVSGRVTGGADVRNTQLNKALPPDNCSTCEKAANSGNSECAALNKACLDDPTCKGFYECLAKKKKADCLVQFPKAEGPFNAAANCVCTRACVSQCGASDSCKKAPKCGYPFPAGDCKTCTEESCCQEAIRLRGRWHLLSLRQEGRLASRVRDECKAQGARDMLSEQMQRAVRRQPDHHRRRARPEGEGEGGGEGGGGGTTTTNTKEGCSSSGASTSGTSSASLALAALALTLAAVRRRRAS